MASGAPDQQYFDQLVSRATTMLQGDEVLLAWLEGEDTDFIRFNNGEVRQAGSVRQAKVHLDLVAGQRHTGGAVVLARDLEVDAGRVAGVIDQLRQQRALVPDDPFLLFNTEPTSSERVDQHSLPSPDETLATVRAAAAGSDLVGIYAAGNTFTAFANSLGQRNWHQTATFNLDWSLYLRADKAAKNLYAGIEWDDHQFQRKIDWSRRQLAVLEREPIDLAPGGYRTYLAPAALQELIDLWSWGGFGEKSHRTRQTPLLKMVTEGAELHPSVRLTEDTAGGTAPDFQEAGFVRPPQVTLIADGRYHDTLVSPRSAREFGIDTNGASAWEAPASLSLAAGAIPADNTAEVLDRGLYVGNLWYTNFSDRAACRTTGMTRFATFWAEGGEIVAPVNVMRFDDTIYNLLGERLVGLTDHADTMLDPSTYEGRSTESARLPGALVEEMTFTL